MRARLTSLLTLVGLSPALAQGWPALPAKGFVSGRAAVERDVADGNAIFVLKVRDVPVGKPARIVIPQYAYLINPGGEPTPVIVVQAEEANGIKLFGVRDLAGKESVAKEADLQLLGLKPPN